MNNKELASTTIVIFGATGDLTHRKLMPALYNLEKLNILSDEFKIIAIGRREKTSQSFIQEIDNSVKANIIDELDKDSIEKLKKRICYHKQDITDDEGYGRLKKIIGESDNNINIIYYLAISPQYFDIIIGKLDKYNMAYKKEPWRRVVIEKPFGMDLTTAQKLNKKITSVFPEENIYRIDHYLGKEMLQNLIVLRFANSFFEPIWNNKYIDNIQISSSETLGVETRGAYYEKSGILRDMVQNHMLQLLTLTAMEIPKSFGEKHIRDEKLNVLKTLTKNTDNIEIVYGQYGSGFIDDKKVIGYRQEDRVDKQSNVATFAAIKLCINNKRWRGVPFYIRTGKRLKEKTTEVVIQFKHLPQIKNFDNTKQLKPNLLVIKIHPEEGMEFTFNTKKPRTISEIVPVNMDFCQNCEIGMNSPEAYERLLQDVIRGDATLFTRWDEVKYSWILIDKILKLHNQNVPIYPNYTAGSWGPQKAHDLLEKDNREWWNKQDNHLEVNQQCTKIKNS